MIKFWYSCMGIFKRLLVATVLLGVLVGLPAGCGGGAGGTTDGETDEGGTTTGGTTTGGTTTGGTSGDGLSATLSSIQSNIFTPTCATAGCHSSGSVGGGLVLEAGSSFADLVGTDGQGVASSQQPAVKRVAPGDPDNSYLIMKLEGTAGSRMPRGQAPLTAEEIAVIRQWITEGARDN